MYDDGCAQGQRDAALGVGSGVFLDFGGEVDGGTQLIGGQFKSWATIASFVQSFAKGYYVCTGSDTSTVLHIAVGTNNSLHTSSADGDSWANEMSIIESDISGYASQVVIYGASDMEQGWATASATITWFQGYESRWPADILELRVSLGVSDLGHRWMQQRMDTSQHSLRVVGRPGVAVPADLLLHIGGGVGEYLQYARLHVVRGVAK